jgi:hypothetical protein
MGRKRPYVLVANIPDGIAKLSQIILPVGIDHGHEAKGVESVLTVEEVFLIGHTVAGGGKQHELAVAGGSYLTRTPFFILLVKISTHGCIVGAVTNLLKEALVKYAMQQFHHPILLL